MADPTSFNDVGREQLGRVWRAVWRSRVPDRVLAIFDILVPPGVAPTGWRSFIGDDHTPYEFSLLLGTDDAEIRVMAEVLPSGDVTEEKILESTQSALRVLARDFGADLSRLDAVSDIFLPAVPDAAFALWLAATFDRRGEPSFKAYLNPLIRGRGASARLVEEMLERLGFRGAWATMTRAMPRGPDLDELRFVSLDLTQRDVARVKVYAFHHRATGDYLERIAAVTPGHEPGSVLDFCRTVTGGDGVFRTNRQPATCLAFVSGACVPITCTAHVPVRAFAGDDATAHARVRRALSKHGIGSAPLDAAVEALRQQPLDRTRGVLAWTSFRTGGASPKITVYLAPCALTTTSPRPDVLPTSGAEAPRALVERSESEPILLHPWFRRFASARPDLGVVSLMLLNLREAITRDFARRLASLVARIAEEDIRSILAKQLSEELGEGKPTRTHRLLFERFLGGLVPWQPQPITDAMLEPGRTFAAAQEELYLHRSPYEGLGATLIMEVCGKQFDLFLGEQLRRAEDKLPEAVVEWLTVHEAVEVHHVNESLELADLVSSGAKARLAARGATELRAAAWAFLDGMYRLSYA